ncbi:hypothetical protein NJ76_28020, partial [Rhodococcus sp. IITR03]
MPSKFVGRSDNQIKLRGVRIEPGEIDTALTALDGVDRAVTLVRSGRLISYVTGENLDGSSLDDADLRAPLRTVLPAHLVPSAIVPLAAIPLTSHARSTPPPCPNPPPAKAAKPRTETERTRRPHHRRRPRRRHRRGTHRRLFAVGGNSLLARPSSSAACAT